LLDKLTFARGSRLSEAGDPLEAMARVIDFAACRPLLESALGYSDGAKGGRTP
jgi:hypothetical protein